MGITLVSLIAVSGPVAAQSMADKYALGDWDGGREALARAGVDVDVNYVSELAHNFTGGTKRLTRHTGQLGLSTTLDLARLWGWDGAIFRFSIAERDGNSLNADANVDALMPIQEVYGRNQTWRIAEFWLGKTLLDGKLQLKTGRMGPGGDFSLWDCSFMNVTFCGSQNGNIVSNYWTNWPISQWAINAKWNFSTSHYASLGVYQVNPSYLETGHGLDLYTEGAKGVLIPLEFGWNPTFDGGYKGQYSVGGWYTNYRQPDVLTDVSGGNAAATGLPFDERTGAYGIYVTARQQVTHGRGGDANAGLSVFVEYTQADRNTALTDRAGAAYVIYHGIGTRSSDEIGIGLGVTQVNGRRRQYLDTLRQHDGLTGVQGSEVAFEAYYGLQVRPWLVIRPDVQWIERPGGLRDRNDAYVVGAKSIIRF